MHATFVKLCIMEKEILENCDKIVTINLYFNLYFNIQELQ